MRNASPLLIAATALAIGSVAFVCSPSAPTPQSDGPPPLSTAAGTQVHLADHLPPGHVTDGSVDYSPEFRLALELAANGELVLPNHPVQVSKAPGRKWCLRIVEPTTVTGSTGSVILCNETEAQVLRAEYVDGVVLRGFTVRGPGGDGQGLAHGLVQVTGGSKVVVENLTIQGADADGIGIALAHGVRMEGCTVEDASKAALYVSKSRGVLVTGNRVMRFGGHRTPSGHVVGIGIQLSSNTDVVCSNNIIEGGTGSGILCNANLDAPAPIGTIIEGNRIVGVRNLEYLDISSGIRLANGASEKFTQTLVRGNSIRASGMYGIFVENHDGTLVQGNTIAESDRSPLTISSARDVVVSHNVMLNSGTEGLSGVGQVFLLNDADRVHVEGNLFGTVASGAHASTAREFVNTSSGSNVLVPRRTVRDSAPTDGRWSRGDIAYHSNPIAGAPLGWVCVSPGEPGVWRPLPVVE